MVIPNTQEAKHWKVTALTNTTGCLLPKNTELEEGKMTNKKKIPCIQPTMQASGWDWGSRGGKWSTWHYAERPVIHRWTLTYLGDEWRWDSEPYGKAVNVDWAWRELKDAGEELPEAVKSEDGDSGLQSQELLAEQDHVPTDKRRERTMVHTRAGSVVVTESEGTYSHRHSTVMAIHRWSNKWTDGQTGRGLLNHRHGGLGS